MKSCCVLRDHYDVEHDKAVFQNTTPDLQDQDHSMQDQDRFFWYQTSRVLSPTVSDHITENKPMNALRGQKAERQTAVYAIFISLYDTFISADN